MNKTSDHTNIMLSIAHFRICEYATGTVAAFTRNYLELPIL